MRDRFTIQDWAENDRPREKFIQFGANSLSNAELLAILIRAGNRDENAIELARKILRGAENSLVALRQFCLHDFLKFKGIGTGKALSILAAFELAKRCDLEKPQTYAAIHSSRSAADIAIPMLRDLKHEECWLLYLNQANKLVGKERISIGGINATVVDVRVIIKNAVAKGACNIILAHNHPSGSTRPSKMDEMLTTKVKNAVSLCDIQLIDHIIVAGNNYFSFSDERML